MPMFLWVGAEDRIRAVGPTLAKLLGGTAPVGERFSDHFCLTRLRATHAAPSLSELTCERLHLKLRRDPELVLRGLAVRAGVDGREGVLVNLSFGIGVADAVRDHRLTDADFAPTDLAIELLYLQEAKSAVLAELNALNGRLEAARRSAETRAMRDPLTGLPNRRALDIELAAAVERARGGEPFALALLDLDRFKAVNDLRGHAAGDAVLIRLAAILGDEMRRMDVAARVGGDEFVLLLNGVFDDETMEALGQRIIARIEEPIGFAGGECRISGSIGAALSVRYCAPDPERMMQDADAALYASKHAGRGRCTVAPHDTGHHGQEQWNDKAGDNASDA